MAEMCLKRLVADGMPETRSRPGIFSGWWIVAGPTLAGILFDRAGNYETVFVLCVALALFGCGLMLLVRPPSWNSVS